LNDERDTRPAPIADQVNYARRAKQRQENRLADAGRAVCEGRSRRCASPDQGAALSSLFAFIRMAVREGPQPDRGHPSMNSALSQDDQVARLDTPFGKDVLVLQRFEGSEGLGELFEFHIHALSEKENLDFDQAIGKPCVVTHSGFDKPRIFHGILVDAEWLGPRDYFQGYRLVLRPWLWLLSQTTDCRMFHNQTAPDIIKKIFSDLGFTDFRFSLTESHPKLEYCVQYRESDLAFVSRLMEQHGIYYFFEHSADKHLLVLADSKSSHKPIPGRESVPLMPSTDTDRSDQEHFEDWFSQRRFRSGKVQLNDYNFKKPTADMKGDASGSERYTGAKMELYDYPGKYDERSDGTKYAKVCLEAQQALDHRRFATGDALSLFPGGQVKLEKHPVDAENAQYMVVRANHSFFTEAYRSAGGGDGGRMYDGSYEFLPVDRPFRSPILTPKPLVYGPQTAVVVGNAGEEIDVDNYGRIWVQFHWDREGKKDRNSSLPIRVAQCWAGKGWGGQFIPRIGMEVVVEFLEGDPDRPLVVGAVYNEDYKHPYPLPANKTQSGIKSDSTKGHGGYNEIMFEDKKKDEFIRIHAQKNLNVVVLNNESRSVGYNMDTSIYNAETRTIGKNFKPPTGKTSLKTDIKNGDVELSVDSGTLKYEAKLKMEFIVGPSKITIDPKGITLDAPTITIKAAGVCIIEGLPVKIN
jgi:type VI secretion system secreted protein VgrG